MHKEIEKWAHDLEDDFRFIDLRKDFPELGRDKARQIIRDLIAAGSLRKLPSKGAWGQDYLRIRGAMKYQK